MTSQQEVEGLAAKLSEVFDPALFGKRVLASMGQRSCRDVAPEIGISHATLNRVSRGGMPDVPTYLRITDWLRQEASGTRRCDLGALAEHHQRQGLFHAKAAMNNSTWYHAHAADTAKAANHFAVAAALRAHLTGGIHE